MMIKAVLFDLDGVITATSELHYIAWKQLAAELGITIDREFNETLKGVDRQTSLERILKLGNVEVSNEEFNRLMESKNSHYVESLKSITADDLLPGIEQLLIDLQSNGIKVSIASASKNAPYIIERLGIGRYIDYIANPNLVQKNKPAPDIFLLAAAGVNVDIKNCVGVEDAVSGVEAITAAGAKSISIGIDNSLADIKLQTTEQLTIELIKQII